MFYLQYFHIIASFVPRCVGSCLHGMARPRVADGEDPFKIWRVAVNILNKQSRTAEEGGSPVSGWGVELTTDHRKIHRVTKCYTGPRTWTDSLE
jgi:hypothetical protein